MKQLYVMAIHMPGS